MCTASHSFADFLPANFKISLPISCPKLDHSFRQAELQTFLVFVPLILLFFLTITTGHGLFAFHSRSSLLTLLLVFTAIPTLLALLHHQAGEENGSSSGKNASESHSSSKVQQLLNLFFPLVYFQSPEMVVFDYFFQCYSDFRGSRGTADLFTLPEKFSYFYYKYWCSISKYLFFLYFVQYFILKNFTIYRK